MSGLSIWRPVFLCAFIAVWLAGCDRKAAGLEPDKISFVSPDVQFGRPGETLTNAVRLEVLSLPVRGALGGTGSRKPLEGVRIKALAADAGSGIQATPAGGMTDAGGGFVCSVTLGQTFGDHYLDFVCEDAPEIRARARFVAGVSKENDGQEVAAGDALARPLRVRLTDETGGPLVGETVYFVLSSQPGKAGRVSRGEVRTDTNGVAETGLKTDPSATGVYEVRVDVSNRARGVVARPFFLRATAMNAYGMAIGILCGIALFIYGMTLLSDGLLQIAGSRMKSTLAYITRNRFSAIMAGTLVTAVIQSSSAMTVMTVGFVNAGLLSLRQAIGVIFGANIGTTATGQIISFNLDGVALPAIVVGVVVLLVARKAVWVGAARTVLGFGLLFFGMNMMAAELKDAAAFPSFVKVFQMVDCAPLPGQPVPLTAILGAVAIGTITTMIVQSSSATIGLTMALASSGLLNFWTAFPIVLGDNIGTTITAVLASLNTNRTAKQTAAAHSLFNVIGTFVMVALLYVPWGDVPCFLALVDAITAGAVFHGENIARHVAMAHTLFNVTNVVLLTAFIPNLAWLCERLVPARQAKSGAVRLEPHLLNTPALALVCVGNALAEMVEKAWGASVTALTGYRDSKPASVEALKIVEDEVDAMQNDIMDYLVQLTRRELPEGQAAMIPVLMHCVNDAERISDLAYLIARRVAALPVSAGRVTEGAMRELDDVLAKAGLIYDMTQDSLRHGSGAVKAVEILMGELKPLLSAAITGHVARLNNGTCMPERGLLHVDVVTSVENMVRHLENIAQRADLLTADR